MKRWPELPNGKVENRLYKNIVIFYSTTRLTKKQKLNIRLMNHRVTHVFYILLDHAKMKRGNASEWQNIYLFRLNMVLVQK